MPVKCQKKKHFTALGLGRLEKKLGTSLPSVATIPDGISMFAEHTRCLKSTHNENNNTLTKNTKHTSSVSSQ